MERNITAKEIFGDFVIDVKKITLDEIKKCEDISIYFATKMLYEEILRSSFVKPCVDGELKKNKIKLIEPLTTKDYCDNFVQVANILRDFGNFIDKYKNSHSKQNSNGIDAESAAAIYAIIDRALTKADIFFKTASEIVDLNNQVDSKKEYLTLVSVPNKKAARVIKQLEKIAREKNGWAVGSKDLFHQIYEAFDLVVSQIDIKNLEETKVCKTSVVLEINKKEQERIKMIEKANDLYGCFVIDFLRDVESQTPYTARYMVEKLNEKHDKFLKSFEMPLSSDTSIGKANECISQIKSMIDYVSKISEASYVVSGYQK